MQASDWNAVSFGNDCMIGGVLQFHTLENMMLKVKQTDIREGSAVNFGATVMGGAVIEPEATLLPLSMVLKEMHLPTATYWGSPTEPVSGVQHTLLPLSLSHDQAADTPSCLEKAATDDGKSANEVHGSR
jgi:carbonic anhydrase/acetyltransferase-like protein (isoleucine patch superfamily)